MNIPTFSKNTDPTLRKLDRFIEWFLLTLILCVTLLVCCSCGSTKVVTLKNASHYEINRAFQTFRVHQ